MQDYLWGIAITTTSHAAVAALNAATLSLLSLRDDTARHLAGAVAADPGLVVGHAALGMLHLASGRGPRHADARRCLSMARVAFAQRGGTQREGALVAALGAWTEKGDMWQAADRLDERLRVAPVDPLLLRLAYAIRFMLGDPVGMRFSVQQALGAMPADAHGRSYLRGCLAFALGETGERWRAESEGRLEQYRIRWNHLIHCFALDSTASRARDRSTWIDRALAVAEAPDDLWGAHAVAHVMEEGGRARDGLAWLEGVMGGVTGASLFVRHPFWRRALFHLHLGERDAALHLYDTEVCREPGPDFRDLANAASLLWRLDSQGGGEVGAARWDEPARIGAP